MRQRISLSLHVIALSVALATPRLARATDCSGVASTCVDDDVLWPHAGPARFVFVGSTETVAAGQLGFGLVATYLSRPIRLQEKSPGGAGTELDVIGDQGNGTFLFSYGMTSRLELDLALPITFGQGGTGLAPITGGYGPKDTAVRDMRFGLAYALLPHTRAEPDARASKNPVGLLARFEVSAPTGDSSQFAGQGTAAFIPSVAADWQAGRWFAGAEVGARIRPEVELLGARIGSQLVTSLGVGFGILPHELLTATLEAWALPTFAEQHTVTLVNGALTSTPNGQHIAPAEWQLAVRTAPLRGGDLAIQLGGGGPIPLTADDVPRPQVRITLGVRWEPMARDTDGDGLLDAVDKCPDQAAHTVDGCPAAAPVNTGASAVDLHLSVTKDPCSGDPDVVGAFATDGCPVPSPSPGTH
jgi:hypothetical protein